MTLFHYGQVIVARFDDAQRQIRLCFVSIMLSTLQAGYHLLQMLVDGLWIERCFDLGIFERTESGDDVADINIDLLVL